VDQLAHGVSFFLESAIFQSLNIIIFKQIEKKRCEWKETERRRSLYARWAKKERKRKQIGWTIDCNMNFY
jgi:hypothetical protein